MSEHQKSLTSVFQLNQQTILVIVLMIASFFIGSLYTKNQYLEKNVGTPVKAAVPQQGNQPAAQAPVGKVRKVSNDERIRGNKNAKITLVEYSDFECPFCKSFHPITQELLKVYGDKIRLVFRDYPLPFHQNAQKEAEAGRCIAELGGSDAFWNYADKIFERTTSNGTGFALTDLGPLAAEVGVNQQSFQQCLDAGKYAKVVKDEVVEGNAAGVNGTPTSFIIDSMGKTQILVGAQPVDAFKTVIDQVLK
ncbi:disulfide bond formation protein DsbA [Candidatus Roizmanbacteria bacterium CG_4_10_14_3_um_filter_39_13]|uniref:Disulfide bond formation protein DsbA n=1 Tax=Candidatus Roizmanbacteria bacterium CG_4_10_14_3_um_filter_39_13 TaxID=1974831 RepID=A0A2M7LKX8_9BACT|nr:MAG: disulfide bond formation protein DsbA [Candidatus Roizmanbacteria bacterium CG_4_10_14_3_um_filter_39_13]